MTEERQPFWQIAGPITLLAAYALAGTLPLSTFPYDLFLTGALGYYFCSRWHVKGCSYAFMLLALAGICGHLFLETHHFLRLGIEASFACSFIVTALGFETEAEGLSGLVSQLTSRAAAIQNLEEEIEKVRQSQVELQISSAERMEELQKNFDEISAEKSSLEILNDVLRKNNAVHFDEKIALENQASDDKRNLVAAQYALEQLQNELNGLKKIDLAIENESLLRELNQARFDKEQMRQINEALVRLHADESIRAKEADDLLKIITVEKQRIEEQFLTLRQEIEQLTEELARLVAERQQMESKLSDLQTASYFEENDTKLIEELKADRAEIQQRLNAAEQTILDLAKVEFLYKQLKTQFEEKNRVLHETRSALFKVETELQTTAIEKEEETSLLPEALKLELSRLDEEISELQGENVQLQDLVTHLIQTFSESAPFALHRTPLPAGQPSLEETLREALIPKRKKKAKKPVQQDLLF